MKKGFKRALALVLCASMLVSAGAIGASAATETTCDGKCDHSPIVILPGINHSPTYLYDNEGKRYTDADGNEVGGTLLILELSKLWGTLPKLILSLLGTLTLQHNVGLEQAAYEAASAAFWVQKCDDKGNHVENLQTQRWNHPISKMNQEDKEWLYRMIPLQTIESEYGGDHIYMYTFNLVGDPITSANELDEYIQMVKDQTKHDKVTLLPVSLGGTILTAYLNEHGHEDIDEIVNVVACLDGTDVLADMMERKWNLTDEYFYHEFIPPILGEDAALGYLINCVLHILPRAGVDAILSGAISGILDTVMLNCPQIWAMVPSGRYDALAERYLKDKPELKARTDRFQDARLNLVKNIEAAVADGVKVNTIAAGNLDLGEQDYTFFNIVASADKVNSDGIINLSSTTLGATGAAGENTLGKDYKQANTSKNCSDPTHNHISPDNMIDVSTAALPDNTWIFLEQHHEVGNNDVVLNLAKAILLDEVENVYSNPEKYPQFNYSCNTKYIRRWRLPDAKKLLEEVEAGTVEMTAADKAELIAAIADGEAAVNATIANAEKTQATENRLNAILAKYGRYTYPEEPSSADVFFEDALEGASLGLVKWLGGGNLIDWILSPVRYVFGMISDAVK